MSNKTFVDVTASGAVCLGPHVVCDGFLYGVEGRVQTHVHDDHMYDFDKSKGQHNIYLTEATKQLLIAERNADLPYRENVIALPTAAPVDRGAFRLELYPNGHMLGSVQVAVELDDGTRVGYSGDFGWPQPAVMKVDQLVVDSTYGRPGFERRYSQAEVEARLLEHIRVRLMLGPVHVVANRGTLHRALQVLAGAIKYPIIGSRRLIKEVEVYRQFGACIDPVLDVQSAVGQQALAEGRYVRFYGKGDRHPADEVRGSRIVLSAFMTSPDDPVLEYSQHSCRIALSDHADFDATVDYVAETGAKRVVTDNTRGGNAITLAAELSRRLGILCSPSTNTWGREWTG